MAALKNAFSSSAPVRQKHEVTTEVDPATGTVTFEEWRLIRVFTSSRQLIEQRLRLHQVGRIETFGEPAVDRREDVAGFSVAALVAAKPCEAK